MLHFIYSIMNELF